MKPSFQVLPLFMIVVAIQACTPKTSELSNTPNNEEPTISAVLRFNESPEKGSLDETKSIQFDLEIPVTGRYQIAVFAQPCDSCEVWLEDYIGNPDDRTYNITGTMKLTNGTCRIDGAPLAQTRHRMAIHGNKPMNIDSLVFTLMHAHRETPTKMTQKMDGESWKLVWSDEFDGTGLPDSNKWSYNVGNWGWGNNEPQYYTAKRLENARQEGGCLVIDAIKNDLGLPWTSARLTTQGKIAFTYGKIEFRAKVPEGRGTWAAGWLLGDAYEDELSWPYCGEIDVLECVGYEIDDNSGNGLNHATCHTRAYYFKQGNQIGSEIAVDSMNTKFHTYAVEWYPDRIEGFVDGVHYYTYDKTANELEWPFHQPHNIILNLAVGGGWGGAQGIDEAYDKHAYILDYVRVYSKE